MKRLILPALASLALVACTVEESTTPAEGPDTPQETPDVTPKAKTVAFSIDGMT